MTVLNAAEYIHTRGFPDDVGKLFARNLLEKGVLRADLEIDVSGLPNGLLISPFVHGFLQELSDTNPSLLDTARQLQWRAKYEFQENNIASWVARFDPQPSARA
jgi:hypothetical protein